MQAAKDHAVESQARCSAAEVTAKEAELALRQAQQELAERISELEEVRRAHEGSMRERAAQHEFDLKQAKAAFSKVCGALDSAVGTVS